MPYYRCLVPKDSIDYDKRSEIATAITDVHCGISAAPRNFVHVAFIETEEGKEIKNSHGSGSMKYDTCLLYTSPSPRDKRQSRMPSSA